MKNNLRLLAIALGIGIATSAFAQKDNVGIGTTKPDQSAVLDLSSSTKGLLMPRMSLQQRGAIQNPAQGLVVYQTDFLSGFYFYDGAEWKTMTSQNSVAGVDGDWTTTGNSGTNATTNFIGTTDAQKLVFRVNNLMAGYIDPTGSNNLLFGYVAGGSTASFRPAFTGIDNVGIGTASLNVNTTGSANVGVGVSTLAVNTTGSSNIAIGSTALSANTTGDANLALGNGALRANTNGSANVGIGAFALLRNTTGTSNTAIGNQAGYSNVSGIRNVFIGSNAGFSELGSDKLYIANSNTTQPTVYGDFSANFVSIGNNITLAKRDAIATAGSYGLLVEKGILTEKLKVATIASADWADYVFDEKYKMLPLEEVEKFVIANKHLPNVPSAEEMSKNGLDVVTSDSKLLEKIEELTLYMIEMNKEIKALKAENAKLKK
ncbi:hypothetical protein [Emticicia sp.]|uniref:hypothetical protein n=1 Tax=Emticicia sp. TaxID=1930953 RepID=UPI003753AD34